MSTAPSPTPTPVPATGAGLDPPAAGEVEAARLLLARMGIRPEDLIDTCPRAAGAVPWGCVRVTWIRSSV